MTATPEMLMVLAQNVPAAVAVVLTVWLFLRTQKQMAMDFQSRMSDAAVQCHETQNRSTDALMRHAEAASKQAEALAANSSSLQQLIMAVTRCQGVEAVEGED